MSRAVPYVVIAAMVLLALTGCEPPNAPPVARFTYKQDPYVFTYIGDPYMLGVVFNATESRDSDGYVTDYDFSFGDGGSSTSVAPVHHYATAGSYEVTLTVTDDEGATDTVTHVVSVVAGDTSPPSDCCSFYVASDNSDVFHRASCSYVASIHLENRLCYCTRSAAIASGKRPCMLCDP